MINEQIPQPSQNEETSSDHQPETANESQETTRRSFLRSLLSAGAATAIFGPKVWEEGWNKFGAKDLERGIENVEQELSDKYGIPIKVWVEEERAIQQYYSVESLKKESLYLSYKGLLSLKKSLIPYPPDFLRQTVSRIELVYKLEEDDDRSRLGAMLNGELTITAGRGSMTETHKAVLGSLIEPSNVHHEIAHTITHAIPQEEWKALHQDAEYLGEDWRKLERCPSGFARRYSTKSIYEDMATVVELLFSGMDVSQNKNDFELAEELLFSFSEEQRVKNDRILQSKIDYIKRWYEQETAGKMNKQFWEDYYAGRVDESYWDKR